MKVAITGANGHLGLRLISALNLQQPGSEIVALVRSERAANALRATDVNARVEVVDYADAKGLAAAAAGCDFLVHLVGIIKESAHNSFHGAHEAPCQALVDAQLSVRHIVALGIVGTSSATGNACLKSRAAAEQILQSGTVPATIIHVPMVLGPGDYASFALKKQATSRLAMTFRSDSKEQPIYCEDVVQAILAALEQEPAMQTIALAGPESLSRKALIARAGRILGHHARVVSLPISLGMLLASVLEKVSSSPPVTRAMLGVLDHDDDIDVTLGTSKLGISLTPLDEMLKAVLR